MKMSYIDTNLSSNESVIYRGRVSLLSMLPTLILGGFLLLTGIPLALTTPSDAHSGAQGGAVIAGIGALLIASVLVKRLSTELALTNRRVIAKFGFISRRTVELTLPRLESVQVRQGVLGRLLGYGSIILAGAGNPQAPIPYIADPLAFRRAVTDAIDQQR